MAVEGETVGSQPRGREAVREALIEAANELFGAKGPDAVSVREVAKKAEVNHALLHRHFGSKEQLIRDVMAEHAASFLRSSNREKSPGAAISRMFDLMARYPAFIKIVAHLLLNGHGPEEFVARPGGLARIVDLVQSQGDDADAHLRAAAAASFCMGWLLFEPFVMYGAGYDGDVKDARDYVSAIISEILAPSQK